MILDWRNDPVTRMASFSKTEIDLQTHINWFRTRLESPDCFLFILMDDSVCVGQLRIDMVQNIGEISYMIAPDKRGAGYGTRMIELAENISLPNLKVLTGLVEKSNLPSRKCFLKNGYAEFVGGEICSYIKVLK